MPKKSIQQIKEELIQVLNDNSNELNSDLLYKKCCIMKATNDLVIAESMFHSPINSLLEDADTWKIVIPYVNGAIFVLDQALGGRPLPSSIHATVERIQTELKNWIENFPEDDN